MRYPFFDSYRGFALIIMAIYHFSFDLNAFGVIQQDMNNSEFWLDFRALIMTSFLGLVGVSFQFARSQYQDPGFRKRLWMVGGCAALISIGTYFVNPQTWIFFGVLHFIFVASLLAPVLVRFPKTCLVLGIGFIVLPMFYRSMWFYQPGLILSGLSPIRPITEDFSPFFPWLGVTMIGVWIGSQVKSRKPMWAQKQEIPRLSRLGRHSLVLYMTHQLVLYPLAWVVAQVLNY
jgi:uncharacterized membrane protein